MNENVLMIRDNGNLSDRPYAAAMVNDLAELAKSNESTMFDYAAILYTASISSAFLAEMTKQDALKDGKPVIKDGKPVKWSNKDFPKYCVESLGMSKTMVYDAVKLGQYVITVDNEKERRENPKAKKRTRKAFCLIWNASAVNEYERDENGIPIVNPDTEKPIITGTIHNYDFDSVIEYQFAAAMYLATYDMVIVRKLHRDKVISSSMSVRELKEIMPMYRDASLSEKGNIILSGKVEASMKEKAEKEKAKAAAAAAKEEKHKIIVTVEYVVEDITYTACIPLDILESYEKKEGASND